MHMRQHVAIKVLPLYVSRDQSTRNLRRFLRGGAGHRPAQASQYRPALWTPVRPQPDPDAPVLHYFVMDYIEGQDLEGLVREKGPLHPSEACDIICQVASALQEAHKHNLVHRDIKPSNIIITPEHKAMLLDFGLVRQFRHRMTEPGTILGTIDYIAPEQAIDASNVDIRADIYSLGATLFWCLTGRPPFLPKANMAQELICRQTQPPPSIRACQAQLPPELDGVVARMMAVHPDNRYATPQSVVNVLVPFLRSVAQEQHLSVSRNGLDLPATTAARRGDSIANLQLHRVLIVDDDPGIRNFCRGRCARPSSPWRWPRTGSRGSRWSRSNVTI